MTLRVVGAGLGRTGTHSLKLALERLTGGRCYHMLEVFGHPDHLDVWRRAALAEPVDWAALMDGYDCAVDWPAASFWRELSEANPDAVILLSTRSSPDAWWQSANSTIFEVMRRDLGDEHFHAMWAALSANRFTADVENEQAAKAAYERHNADVRANAPADRLVEWQPGDGWQPLCGALGVPVPDEPFPHVNTTADFRAMTGIDAPPS